MRTLVVDDSARMREAIRDMLRTVDGCVIVGEAANGLEALRMARDFHPDLVVMDLHMPVMGGLEALRFLKMEAPATQVVLVTSTLDPDVRQQALKCGALDCLEKAPGLWVELKALLARSSGSLPVRPTCT